MRRLSWMFLSCFVVSLFMVSTAWAIGGSIKKSDGTTVAGQTSWRIKNTDGATQINAFSTCKSITVANGTPDVFIPLETQTEWQSFIDHAPANVSLNSCGPGTPLKFTLTEIALQGHYNYWITGHIDVIITKGAGIKVVYLGVPRNPYYPGTGWTLNIGVASSGSNLALNFKPGGNNILYETFEFAGVSRDENSIVAPFYLMQFPSASRVSIGYGLLPTSYTISGVTSIDKTFCEKFVVAYARLRALNPQITRQTWGTNYFFNDFATPASFSCSDW